MAQSLILAGGCFWCVEHDLREAEGVLEVISGYSGGENTTPTYESHTGHKEVVLVTYDNTKTSYKKILQYFIDHIDPTDEGGQFGDRGSSYTSAIYYQTQDEMIIAHAVLQELNDSHLYDGEAKVELLPRKEFYKAEEYHQNYADKNPLRYGLYRQGSGREAFVQKTCQIRDEKKMVWSE
jgi:methionine-S-sulfoxide reductase